MIIIVYSFTFVPQEVQMYCEEVKLDIYLTNGKKVTLDCLSTDQTEDVLEVCLRQYE